MMRLSRPEAPHGPNTFLELGNGAISEDELERFIKDRVQDLASVGLPNEDTALDVPLPAQLELAAMNNGVQLAIRQDYLADRASVQGKLVELSAAAEEAAEESTHRTQNSENARTLLETIQTDATETDPVRAYGGWWHHLLLIVIIAISAVEFQLVAPIVKTLFKLNGWGAPLLAAGLLAAQALALEQAGRSIKKVTTGTMTSRELLVHAVFAVMLSLGALGLGAGLVFLRQMDYVTNLGPGEPRSITPLLLFAGLQVTLGMLAIVFGWIAHSEEGSLVNAARADLLKKQNLAAGTNERSRRLQDLAAQYQELDLVEAYIAKSRGASQTFTEANQHFLHDLCVQLLRQGHTDPAHRVNQLPSPEFQPTLALELGE